MLIELLKPERLVVDGELLVTPQLRDLSGAAVSSGLKAVKQPIKSDVIGKFFAVDVDLGTFPDAVGLFTLEIVVDEVEYVDRNLVSVNPSTANSATWRT